eukprot:5004597-Pyramimonas_sp.AAC.1
MGVGRGRRGCGFSPVRPRFPSRHLSGGRAGVALQERLAVVVELPLAPASLVPVPQEHPVA